MQAIKVHTAISHKQASNFWNHLDEVYPGYKYSKDFYALPNPENPDLYDFYVENFSLIEKMAKDGFLCALSYLKVNYPSAYSYAIESRISTNSVDPVDAQLSALRGDTSLLESL